jgi:hypothetical protein
LVQLLSLALLFAQLGMAVHASSHLNSDAHSAPAQQLLCGKCASFAPLQNIAGGAAITVFAIDISHDHALARLVVANAPDRAFSAFRSRAPPTLL